MIREYKYACFTVTLLSIYGCSEWCLRVCLCSNNRHVLSLPVEQIVCQVLVLDSTQCLSLCSPSCCRSSQGSLEGRDIQAAEAEEESNSVLSEAIDHSDILAYLSGARSSSRQTQRTPDRSVWWCLRSYKRCNCDSIDLWVLLNNAWLILVILLVIMLQCKWATFAHCFLL